MSELTLTIGGAEQAAFRVLRFSLRERLHEPFLLSIVAGSTRPDLDLDAMILRPAASSLNAGWAFVHNGRSRSFTGICTAAEQLSAEPAGVSLYALRVVPRLGLLALRRAYRIFQRATVPTILSELLRELDVPAALHLDESAFPTLDYKVQYGETDLTFFTRLCEEAGITFAVREDENGQSIVKPIQVKVHGKFHRGIRWESRSAWATKPAWRGCSASTASNVQRKPPPKGPISHEPPPPRLRSRRLPRRRRSRARRRGGARRRALQAPRPARRPRDDARNPGRPAPDASDRRARDEASAPTGHAKHNAPFEGYAWPFVHGAMWDAIGEETRFQKTVRFGAYEAADAQRGDAGSGGSGQVPSTAAVEGFSDAVVVGMMTEVLAQVERQRAPGDLGARLEFTQARTALQKALSELSEQDRRLIDLHYFQDVAIYLVGEPLNMGRTVVKARHRGVLKRLGARLRSLGITEAPPTRGDELQET